MAQIECVYDDYFGNNPSRGLIHRVKEQDNSAIYTMAKGMAPCIHGDCVLVPVPNRDGIARSNLLLVQVLVAFSHDRVKQDVALYDLLTGNARQSLYEVKKEGRQVDESFFGFRLKGPVPENRKVYLVDTVLATGTTANAALKLIPHADILVYAVDKKALEQSVYRQRFDKVTSHMLQQPKQKHQLKHRL